MGIRHSTHLIKEDITLETGPLVTVCPTALDHSPPEQLECPKQGTVSQCRLGKLLLHSFHTAEETNIYPASLQHEKSACCIYMAHIQDRLTWLNILNFLNFFSSEITLISSLSCKQQIKQTTILLL
jgi:hypothetical protein